MSHEHSMPTLQRELVQEYGQYARSQQKKRFAKSIIKILIIPFLALMLMLAGAALTIANLSPTMYTQVKDIIFEKVDFEKITGRPDSINKKLLDNWLILNSDKKQDEENV